MDGAANLLIPNRMAPPPAASTRDTTKRIGGVRQVRCKATRADWCGTVEVELCRAVDVTCCGAVNAAGCGSVEVARAMINLAF